MHAPVGLGTSVEVVVQACCVRADRLSRKLTAPVALAMLSVAASTLLPTAVVCWCARCGLHKA